MKTTIDELIDRVLIENNKTWLNKEQAEWSISEGRLPITRKDVIDIIMQLPIQIYGNNIHVNITGDGVIVLQKES